ncbi:MAG: SDR family oxidoreductase [Candidatus Brocadiaceae bacterium]
MDKDLKDLIEISNAVGSDPQLVQGGGGNTSLKTDGGRLMYVKASGTSLAEMQEGLGYRLVDVQKCIDIIEDESVGAMEIEEREREVQRRLKECCRDELPGRPSVETSLHALLGRCVVHTHPAVLNGLLCAQEGRQALEELFEHLECEPLYIDYAGAGYTLASRMHGELGAYEKTHGRQPEVIFLENHGLFVSTEEAERALELTRHVCGAVRALAERTLEGAGLPPFPHASEVYEQEAVAEVAAAMRRFYSELFGGTALVRFTNDRAVTDFLRHPNARELSQTDPLVPDEVVYCRDSAVWVELPYDMEDAQQMVVTRLRGAEAGVDTPLCVLVDELGLFTAAPSPKLLEAASSTMRAILQSLSVAAHFGGPRPLTAGALEFLRGWEVERFRRGMVSAVEGEASVAGKVALVTGAGSGLGRGISLRLAEKGAHVLLADIDVDGARETAGRIEEQDWPGTGHPVGTDVTSEGRVREMFAEAVGRLGGLDILVNCAGIAPAHPLAEFPVDEWRRALEVNLTGYFLVAREGARCMARQQMGGAIINVSSKTGLEASKHNSAYNATKAGQVHLARGWALDLAEHRIRVNTVCPGNVFTESKIWNEDYIRTVAQKRGIEPEEVIPYYIGLSALKEEITWADVGDAVAFLASESASKITGQALVVDAGQVFVR